MSTLNIDPEFGPAPPSDDGTDALRDVDSPQSMERPRDQNARNEQSQNGRSRDALASSAAPADVGPWVPDRRPPHMSRMTWWYDKIEAFVSRLSVRDNFWHRICSLIWLPYAFFSGIKMKALDANRFAAELPFRRFNRNWYHAMAGGALLANSEIAGGMYLFGVCGGDYTVVCKNLNYTFLRPCFGPALYKMTPRENVKALIAARTEFNLTLDLEVLQQMNRPGERDKRVGRVEATFHVTPKAHHKAKKMRRGER